MSGGGGAGPLGQVINQAQQSTSNPYASQGTPLGQQPTRTAQPYSFGQQVGGIANNEFRPQQQYQPGGGYGMNQSYGNPFGQQMGGYGSPFGGYGNPFGMMGGNPFQGMNPYAQQGGYGSPFGGGYGKQMGGYGMNPYAQAMAQQGMGGYGMQQPGRPAPGSGVNSFGVLTPQQMAQDIPGPQGYTPQQAVNPPSMQQAVGGVGGLGGLMGMLRGRGFSPQETAAMGQGPRAELQSFFNKGGKVDE